MAAADPAIAAIAGELALELYGLRADRDSASRTIR